MNIDWTALLTVAGVSLAFGVGIVVVFSAGLLALSSGNAGGAGSSRGAGNAGGAGSSGAAGRTSGSRRGLAGLCFLLCALAVLYGLWLIVPQFH